MPPMKATGDEHRRQHQRDGDDRPGHLLHGLERRLLGRHPMLDVVHHRLDHDDGVVHHDAIASTRPRSESTLMEKPSSGNTANVPIRDTGTVSSGMSVARSPAGR